MNRNRVEGVLTTGGTTNITGSAVGHRPVLNVGAAKTSDAGGGTSTNVGIITILSEEANAVHLALGLRRTSEGGLPFFTGEIPSHAGGAVKIAAIRSLSQGQRSTMAAYENLRDHHDPEVIVLAGIGGGIHPDVEIGDVVVATRVVYYDLRKERAAGTRRRGEEREAPVAIGHAVNAFFTDHDPAEFPVEDPGGTLRTMRMHAGPIGSGDAVIADRDSEIIAYLAGFNDKILAVDMEAGGLSQACHERSSGSGWLVVRGISDKAGGDKDDSHHRVASWHAATALRELLPYLLVRS